MTTTSEEESDLLTVERKPSSLAVEKNRDILQILAKEDSKVHHILGDLFVERATRFGGLVAVEDAHGSISYRELLQRASQCAHFLRLKGVVAGERIAIFLPRGRDMYVAMLGILEAGAAYIPIDPQYPLDRVAYICSDSGAKFIITTAAQLHSQDDPLAIYFETIGPLLDKQSTRALTSAETGLTADHLAYIIYTSGTTGHPKGVMIRHRSVCHFLRAEGHVLQIQKSDRVLQGFSLSFDMSIEEIWTTWPCGARLVIGTQEMMNSGPDLAPLLGNLGITVWHCVPSLLALQREEIPSLRLINLGGEACPDDLVLRWHRPGLRMINTYGPTETTVTATYAELKPGHPVTIGGPLPGYRTFILDAEGQLVAPGGEGELCIGGPGLAAGYVNLPELTRVKFIRPRFATGAYADETVYRTGDLVRTNEHGELEFLGRIDQQVKIRGFRVELGEIEAVLMQNPLVQVAVVALLKDPHGHDTLVAFVVPAEAGHCDSMVLQAEMRSKLPGYMVPGLIVPVTELPRLPSGKVDRKQLSFPGALVVGARTVVSPRNPTEELVYAIFQEQFPALKVSMTDHFFDDLGGHSLKAAVVVSELRRKCGFHLLAIRHLYEHPSAEKLASCIECLTASDSRAKTSNASGTSGATQEGFHSVPLLRYYLCGAAQLAVCFVTFGISAVHWLLSFAIYAIMSQHGHGFILSLVVAFAANALIIPVSMLLAIIVKWTVIGRYRPGDYPLWGSYYFRWWLVRRFYSQVPSYLMHGTPVLNFYMRCLGARIGRDALLESQVLDAPDLISVGERTCIGKGVTVSAAAVEDGLLKLRPITIGRECVIGSKSALGPDVVIDDFGEVGELTLISAGTHVGVGERWYGSPAAKVAAVEEPRPMPAESSSRRSPRLVALFLSMGVILMPVIAVAPIMPGLIWLAEADKLSDEYNFLFATPLIAALFIFATCLTCLLGKWLLLGRLKPVKIPLKSLYYVRYWFVSTLMDISLDFAKPLYATLFLPPWYRLLGVKVGKRTEISTASSIAWDQLALADECFIADDVFLGAPRIAHGYLNILPTCVGQRTFIGNSALVPSGETLPDYVLIGCLSVPPSAKDPRFISKTSWFGSPAIHLPMRQRGFEFSEGSTFQPPLRLYAGRLFIEFFRVIAPVTFTLLLGCTIVSVIADLHMGGMGYGALALLLPLLYGVAATVGLCITALLKLLLIGVYRPTVRPLWSYFVWRSEAITCLYENLPVPFLLNHLRGTPFINMCLRMMGASIGRRVYCDTTDITEHDVVTVGDDTALNEDCGLQTHLFEDRVMKISRVTIGRRCAVGANAIVLYDAHMEDESQLGDLSMLMKGEVLPRATRWEGSPAQRA